MRLCGLFLYSSLRLITSDMSWKDKAKEIAEKICNVEALKEMDIESNIIYDEDGRLDLNYIRDAILPMIEKAALDGIKYECDNWVLQRTK